MLTQNERGKGTIPDEGKWIAFHQAYDSAVRAYRRGDDVSRAVNWLYVASRKDTSPEEKEMERMNRELGLSVGKSAGSEIEIAPRLWRAAEDGNLVTSPAEAARFEEKFKGLRGERQAASAEGESGDSRDAPAQAAPPGPDWETPFAAPEPGGGEGVTPAPEGDGNPSWDYLP